MCGPLLLINLGILVADIILLGDLADAIGGLTTVLLTVVTAAVGISAVKDQGAAALVRLQQAQMQQQRQNEGGPPGIPPTRDIIEGPLLALAGLYLLIPGFITDGLGALLLLSPVRRVFAGWLANRMRRPPSDGPGGDGSGGGEGGGGGGPVIVVKPVQRPDASDNDRRLDEPRE